MPVLFRYAGCQSQKNRPFRLSVRSLIGRATVSKTVRWGFDSLRTGTQVVSLADIKQQSPKLQDKGSNPLPPAFMIAFY